MKDFTKKLDKILSEDRRPSTGIWYYVYLKPDWKLEVFKATEFGEIGHPDVWRHFLAENVAKHYGVNERDIAALCYGMPRGRIEHIPSDLTALMPNEKAGHWYAYYGEDIPSPLVEEIEKRRIISGFNLNGFAARGMMHFELSEHEKMHSAHQENIQKLIGKIPY